MDANEIQQTIITAVIASVIATAIIAPIYVWWLTTRHHYGARVDHVFINGKWHEFYVRDVCSHCGATIERTTPPHIQAREDLPQDEKAAGV